jgi:hypothetical protein
MPGSDERTPADADRPPASRVADELDERVEAATADGRTPSAEEVDRLEREAMDAAKAKQWDQESTAREGRS